MIIKVAFRNIWRNALRSWVVIAAIAIGIWGGLFVISLANGLTQMRQDKAIETYVSHIQIHDSAFVELGGVANSLTNASDIKKYLDASDKVSVYAERMKIEAYVQSARSSGGVVLNAVDASKEKALTNLADLGETGNFLTDYKRKPPIVIGKKLAESLGVEVGNSIQCAFVDSEAVQYNAVFKVVDVYQSSNSLFDNLNAFVRFEDLSELIQSNQVHEIALKLNDPEKVMEFKSTLIAKFPDLQIESWREIAPELGFADKMMDFVMSLFLLIIMLALAFGIINTMLMAVLERKKELGMLLCVGMNKRKVFWMIAFESIMLALISAPIGMALSWATISYFKVKGIDLSFVSEGLRTVGLDSTLYPVLDPRYYLFISALVIVTAILSCLYPAFKALKLNPIETIRTAV